MTCTLYGGIKNLLRCDEAEVVEGIARYVISQHRTLRVVSRFVERTRHTPIPALLTLLASRSRGKSVLDDLKGLDVVFGGNSSVLVDSVTAGVVSAYVENLDHGSPDLHRFVAAGLIYPSDVNPDLDEMWRFYRRSEWRQALQKFANVNDDESTVLAEALRFIAERL